MFIQVDDPPSRFTDEIERLTEENIKIIRDWLPRARFHRERLIAEPSMWIPLIRELAGTPRSIILDISALPKRVWLFLMKMFLDSPNVVDLVICYSRPAAYPEGPLTQDAEPVEALPGYGRIVDGDSPTLIVGVGYVAFDINQLIEQARVSRVKFVFPFPPGSPAFRRNWRLVDQLTPDPKIPLEIRRVHAMDAFALLEWLKDVGRDANGALDIVALGPKPHALGMGLAVRRLGGQSQVLYSQPRIYRPDYSLGIGKHPDGSPASFAYCLRRTGVDFF